MSKKRRCGTMEFVRIREMNDQISATKMQRKLHVSPYLIDRMGQEGELEGHNGCVNCLDWNANGNILASGSDDLSVIFWNPLKKIKLGQSTTMHVGNIFAVKFIPNSGDSKVVTGAADKRVTILDTVKGETTFICKCAVKRVKRVVLSPDTPDIVWFAAEDGIIRQNDLRCAHDCGSETTNVFANLNNHKGGSAEAKCLAVDPIFPQYLTVGANDPFVRVFDRRMISITSYTASTAWRDKSKSERQSYPWQAADNLNDGCVQYFCPGHLHCDKVNRFYSQYSVTHLTYSLDGKTLLANYGNEQIYIYDVSKKRQPLHLIPPNGFWSEAEKGLLSKGVASDAENLSILAMQRKAQANCHYKEGRFYESVEHYNTAIKICGGNAVLYANRAAALLKRNWLGDSYEALKDCCKALEWQPDYDKAVYRLAKCLINLRRMAEAKEVLKRFATKFPEMFKQGNFQKLQVEIQKVEERMRVPGDDEEFPHSIRTILVRAGFLVSNGRDYNNRISHQEHRWRNASCDYEQRFYGHCNATTDIKEANFFGMNDQYVVAGSDDGGIFFWERESGKIVKILSGDSCVVNCVQPHPYHCMIATSGIDSAVRLWSPLPESEEGVIDNQLVKPIIEAVELNNMRLKSELRGILMMSVSNMVDNMEVDNEAQQGNNDEEEEISMQLEVEGHIEEESDDSDVPSDCRNC